MPSVDVITEFRRSYGRSPDGVFAAPGRVNLIGEHTDYNEGFVLPMALPERVTIAAAVAQGTSTVRSCQLADDVVTFVASEVSPGDVTGWGAYLAGIFWALRSDGLTVPDLDLQVDGQVPLGAGLSSSAALECATALALSELGGLSLSRADLAAAAHRAENDFVGAPTGVMDQMASIHGQAGHLVFIDTRSLHIEPVPFALADHGLELLVVDTRAPHELVDGQYGERRASCTEAARLLGVPFLRDVTLDDLDDALARLPDDLLRRRTRHVVTEDARVLEVVAALQSGSDPREIGPALTASHVSMRDDFEITVPAVDVAVETALAQGAYGARMTGGGFGGCIIALVEQSDAERTFTAITGAFARHGFPAPAQVPAEPSAGAQRLS